APYRGGGAHIDVRWQDKNEVGLAARAAMLRARSGASILHCDRDALQAAAPYDYAKKVYKLASNLQKERFYRDEIDIQETHTKHRKLDSQAAATSLNGKSTG